jgi:hypothetical protein
MGVHVNNEKELSKVHCGLFLQPSMTTIKRFESFEGSFVFLNILFLPSDELSPEKRGKKGSSEH